MADDLLSPRHPRILRWLPGRWVRAMREDTKRWLIACPACGETHDLWELGGVRYLAAGQPRKLGRCTACGQWTWHVVRLKTPAEREAMP